MGKWKQVKKRIDRCWQHRYIPYIKENILELQLTPCYNCPRSPLLDLPTPEGCKTQLT